MTKGYHQKLKDPKKVKSNKKPEVFYHSLELVYQWEIKQNLKVEKNEL